MGKRRKHQRTLKSGKKVWVKATVTKTGKRKVLLATRNDTPRYKNFRKAFRETDFTDLPQTGNPEPEKQRTLPVGTYVSKIINNPATVQRLVTATASALHEQWRANRNYEPRLKPDGNGGEIDIANTPYEHLPAKWQQENYLASEGATRIIDRFAVQQALQTVCRYGLNSTYAGIDNPDSIEEISAAIHEQWLTRNAEWAPASQKVEYPLLSETDKELDRVVARAAVAAVKREIQRLLYPANRRGQYVDVEG